jgi:hypothetical protein
MEEEKPNNTSAQQVHDFYAHSIPGIQKDVKFIMEHLNDPNFDLTCPPSFISVIEEEFTQRYVGEDGNRAIYFEE